MESGRSPSEEKLSPEEFKELIPHLESNRLYEIEIKIHDKWKHLFDRHSKTDVYCNLCDTEIHTKDFKQHLQLDNHRKAYDKVEQFYHHLFTASKNNDDEEKKEEGGGEGGAEDEDEGERRSDGGGDDNDNDNNNRDSSPLRIQPLESAKKYLSYTSYTVKIPLEDVLEVEFRTRKDGKWQKLLTAIGRKSDKGKYNCHICHIFCSGIITVNAHLCGNTHYALQRSVFDVRSSKHKDVTKFARIEIPFDVNQKNDNQNQNQKANDKRLSKEKEKDEKEGLIGVEYVVVLKNANRNGNSVFACCLCNYIIIPTEELMENHITGFNHRLKYCEIHYSDTLKHFETMIKNKKLAKLKYRIGMTFALTEIALGIENYHHYGKPRAFQFDDFLKDKEKIGDEVFGLPHACQEFGPSFSNVITTDDLMRLAASGGHKLSRNLKAQKSRPRFMTNPSGKFYLKMRVHVSRPIKKERQESIYKDDVRSRDSRDSRSLSARRDNISRSISPLAHSRISRKRHLSPAGSRKLNDNRGTDVWNTYRHLISKAAAELENVYFEYRRHPERHPNYDKEWSAFWKRRKDELQLAGKDYRSFDFQPEWTSYFRHRLEELFGEDLQQSKVDVRRQLNIPLDAEEDSHIPYSSVSQHSDEPMNKIKPFKRDTETTMTTTNWKSNNATSTYHRNRAEDTNIWNPPKSSIMLELEKPNVIHILRLMTAHEEHLGSVGSKIIDLLTKALSLEKIYSGDLDQLERKFLNATNCTILKTAQEKLKSQLYADLVEERKINSFNRVIEGTERLLNRAEKMGWSNERDEQPSSSNSLSTKTEIEKIFEALQAKTTYDNSIMGQKQIHGTSSNFSFADITTQQQLNNAAHWDRLDSHPTVQNRSQQQQQQQNSFGNYMTSNNRVGNNLSNMWPK